jgi:hypothetical protein
MTINATENQLIQLGINKHNALMLSRNDVRVFRSEVTNDVLLNILTKDNLVMIHKHIGDKKEFFYPSRKYGKRLITKIQVFFK